MWTFRCTLNLGFLTREITLTFKSKEIAISGDFYV